MEKKNGFTILEMMIVMLIVALLLLITLPNIMLMFIYENIFNFRKINFS